MASAQLAAEEELQQSVVVSEEDLERDDSDSSNAAMLPYQNQDDTSEPLRTGSGNQLYLHVNGLEDLTIERYGGPTATLVSKNAESVEDDAEGEEDAPGEDDGAADAEEIVNPYDENDAEGEEDVEHVVQLNMDQDEGVGEAVEQSTGSVQSGDDEDDNDDEGVGAVKIRPGDTDDEDDVDSEQSHSTTDGSEDSDGAAAWEDAPESHEDEDEESDAAGRTLCLFCKQDEEHDPGEDFEDYLMCSHCGENCAFYTKDETMHTDSFQHINFAREKPVLCDRTMLTAEPPDTHPANGTNQPLVPTTGAVPDQSQPSLETSDPPKHDGPEVFDKQEYPDVDGDDDEHTRLLRKRRTSPSEPDDSAMLLRKRRRRTPEEQHSSRETTSHNAQSETGETDKPRKLRLKVSRNHAAVTVTRRSNSMLISIRVNPAGLRHVMVSKASSNRKRTARNEPARSVRPSLTALPTPFMSSSSSQPFYSFLDRETDDIRTKPYGGILTDVEADTSRTLPTNDDRRRFDEAKQKAEEEWRTMHVIQISREGAEKAKKGKKAAGPASQIECIEFGGWEIDTWYAAPYPEEYSRNRILYICEFCLKYMNSDYVAWRHKLKCPAKHPPGDEIYRHGSVSVFEVDGRKNPVYCQNLCLLAKLFLGSKTLYYDVEPFLFYVLCEYDDLGYHFVGYFSKEKRASSQNNVSCILTLPIHQRKGYGNLLIDFSYLLTRVEKKTGSPEKPLSDMGLVSYRNYWRLVMCQYLLKRWDGGGEDQGSPVGLSFRQISDDTGLTPDDVISALEGLRCLIRDAKTGLYAFRLDLAYCREYVSKWDAKQYVKLHEEALVWTPYVMGRGNTTNFELGPAITAMAPREEEEDRKMVAPPLVNGVSTGVALESQSSVLVPAEIGPAPEKLTPVEGVADEQSALADQPVGGARTAHEPSIPRPAIVRTAPLSSSSSAKPRRSAGGGSVKRPSASKPKASGTSRRKSGGTGRGPGRWPKGTKKSDYGNADSGPGLPPAWVQERQRLLAESAKKKGTGAAAHEAAGGEAARVQFEDPVASHGDARVSGAAAPGGDIAYTNIASDIPAVGDE
ncbi:histone acetyltransferase mst2 [Verticillium dahliae VdLs.17]|uniref:Histone acetyltransferase n=1 Tax=Verticillium dahliae (strain VdLs.17 / ATCC MYA-4575 / FGSC 10137) TaxID=498257 RepID=G2XB33_VERDV|nr:histone acetyltransferase mst2 [Verticillium dahliae VdLs.17]EGY16299.1 histone acetyltransferase mst2 [Verticillium dahliae VdLs.17]